MVWGLKVMLSKCYIPTLLTLADRVPESDQGRLLLKDSRKCLLVWESVLIKPAQQVK